MIFLTVINEIITIMNILPIELQDYIWEYDDTKYRLHNDCIRELDFIILQWSLKKQAVIDLVLANNWPENQNFNEYRKGWTPSHHKFLFKYLVEPYKWINKSFKIRCLGFWD